MQWGRPLRARQAIFQPPVAVESAAKGGRSVVGNSRKRASELHTPRRGREAGNNEVVEEANAKKNIIAIQPLSGQSE